jgi:DNA invertase Pin-like site-specific DNA recombinase
VQLEEVKVGNKTAALVLATPARHSRKPVREVNVQSNSNASPIRAAIYLRMSDDRQENSIDRQRSQVLPYAEKQGYSIVKEYVDEGIAGDEIARRPAFQQLLAEAAAGRFKAILCDDQDRFGRFDSIDAGEIIAPLRRKGVWLDTVAQVRNDWDDFASRMMGGIRQEMRAQESVANSRRVLSAMLLRARDGAYQGGSIHYGYRHEPDLSRGKNGKRLVPDGHRADVVRFIFRRYDEGATLGQIARELHDRGAFSPRGQAFWSRSVLWELLQKRAYVGDAVWGQKPRGKYHRSAGAGKLAVTPRADKKKVKRAPAEEWIVRENDHEPLIDRELFARVQARLRGNKKRTTPHVGGGDFVLTKMLTCGHCGGLLLGATRKGNRVYSCGTYIRYGKDRCGLHTVRESVIVRLLIRKLQELFLDPDNLAALRAEMRSLEESNKSEANLERMRKRVELLAGKIERGGARLLELPKEVLPEASAALAAIKRERDGLLAEIDRVQRVSPVADLEQVIEAAEKTIWSLQDAVEKEDWPLFREAIRELIHHVELHWSHHKAGKRVMSRLEHGVIYLHGKAEGQNLFSPVCRGRSFHAPRCPPT